MKSMIRAIKSRMASATPDSVYFPFINAKNSLQGRKHHVQAGPDGLFQIDDRETRIIISERSRQSRYKRGIKPWIHFLAGQYNLSELCVNAGGVFIDCGANVGELGFWARANGLEYHAFEPEEREARCCDLNNFEGEKKTNRLGLWYEATELKFYSKAASADSSFIEIADYDYVDTLQTTTLDLYVEQHSIDQIEVLKVEAEGAEPEVLQGARESLSRCRFVTVDCGRERGILRQDTVRDVCNWLYGHGFQIVDSDMKRLSILFENRAMSARRAA